MVQIEKIMILSVPESNGEIFDKILDVIRHSGISDVTEVNNESVIQVGELIIDSVPWRKCLEYQNQGAG